MNIKITEAGAEIKTITGSASAFYWTGISLKLLDSKLEKEFDTTALVFL